jgi:hypothetical protein
MTAKDSDSHIIQQVVVIIVGRSFTQEAYSVVTASKEYDPSLDTTSSYGNPELVIPDNISGDGTGKPSRLRRPASLFGKEKDPIEVNSAAPKK